MKKVIRTKVPSYRQTVNMVSNLRDKFGGTSTITLSVHTYNHHRNILPQFFLHYNPRECESLDTWKEVQDKYFQLMESSNA